MLFHQWPIALPVNQGLIAAAGWLLLCAFIQPATAQEFGPITGTVITVSDIESVSTQTNEQQVPVGSIPSHTQTSSNKGGMTLTLLEKGQLLNWFGVGPACYIDNNSTSLAIVYSAKGTFSGTVTCDGSQSGTDAQLSTWAPKIVTFESKTKFVGDEIHLDGTMKVEYGYTMSTKGGILKGENANKVVREIKQALVLKLSGATCAVKNLTWTDDELNLGEIHADYGVSTTRQTITIRRSLSGTSVCKVQ